MSLIFKELKKYENKSLEFNPVMFEKITGVKIEKDEMMKILDDLGFVIEENKKNLQLKIPTWRPDISQEVDVV